METEIFIRNLQEIKDEEAAIIFLINLAYKKTKKGEH